MLLSVGRDAVIELKLPALFFVYKFQITFLQLSCLESLVLNQNLKTTIMLSMVMLYFISIVSGVSV